MKPGDTTPFCFPIAERGRPFRNAAGFGTWFKKQGVAASLSHRTMHGPAQGDAAAHGRTADDYQDMKSVSGQRSDRTLAKSIENGRQTRIADAAMKRLSAWESSVRTDAGGVEAKTVANARMSHPSAGRRHPTPRRD